MKRNHIRIRRLEKSLNMAIGCKKKRFLDFDDLVVLADLKFHGKAIPFELQGVPLDPRLAAVFRMIEERKADESASTRA